MVRRISRDTVERGRTLDSIMAQYEATVKPMHAAWVEPSKARADVIVNSETGQDRTRVTQMLSNHLRVESGLLKDDSSSRTTSDAATQKDQS